MESQNSRQMQPMEKRLKSWLAKNYAPACAVFASGALTEFMRENASLSPAEFIRPFTEVGALDNRSVLTFEKSTPYKFQDLQINMVDINKVDGRYYKEQEYSGLFRYILDIEKPKDTEFATILNLVQGEATPIEDAKKGLDAFLLGKQDTEGGSLTPWYHRWKKWFLGKTRFKEHELLDQPVAFIFFVMADEPDPLRSIDKMRRDLPSQYKSQVYHDGPHSIQEFVLILNHRPDNSSTYHDALNTISQKFNQNMIFEIPMSDRGKVNADSQTEDLWENRFIDLDERMLIDVQVAMADPTQKRIRGQVFSQRDRQKARAHMKKIIEVHMMPFIRKRIRDLEESVAKTRKGVKNRFMSVFKATSDRGENDGQKDSFRMNKAELELRNLCDLAFVSQDYETAYQNAQYPYKDFKGCKASRFAASCLEVQILGQVCFELSYTNMNLQQLDSNVREAYSLYLKSNKSDLLIKFAIMVSELYEILGRLEQSAQYLVKIANEIPRAAIIVALFFERAGLQYLKQKQYRKFAYYTSLAAMNFSSANQTDYALNCYRLIHPFYQAHYGWHHIRFLVYSNLGHKLHNFQDQEITNDFFKNYLKLCSQVDDSGQQKAYFNTCLQAIQAWLQRQQTSDNALESTDLLDLGSQSQPARKMLDVGELMIPELLEDQIDIFVDSEKLYSNLSMIMIANQFSHLPYIDSNQEQAAVQITMKIDLNQNVCQWKHMAKSVTDFVKLHKPSAPMGEKLQELSIDEITEIGIYDALSINARKELLSKKTRKVFCNTPVTMRVVLQNPLHVAIAVKNIRVVCSYTGESQNVTTYTQTPQSLLIDPFKKREVILQVTPLEVGDFTIERLEWELFEVVLCKRQLIGISQNSILAAQKSGKKDSALSFKAIETSGECSAEVKLEHQDLKQDIRMIFSECKNGFIKVKNTSSEYSMRHAFVSCSHPILFNFENSFLFDELAPNQEHDFPIQMRASLIKTNNVKFLIRYEVSGADGTAIPNSSRYRFQRVQIQLESEQCFQPHYRINLSSRNPGTHLVNLNITGGLLNAQGGRPEIPVVDAIEIINKEKRWKIANRDNSGKFFVIEKATPGEEEHSVMSLQDQFVSVREDQQLSMFLQREIDYVLDKQVHEPTDEQSEIDFVLHWRIQSSNRRGIFCTFKRQLFPTTKAANSEAESKPLQITFDYPRIIKVGLDDGDLPVSIPLELSITPLTDSVERVTVKIAAEDDDERSLSWVGKIEHQIQFENKDARRLTMTALAHEIGVYDISQVKFEAYIKGRKEPIQVPLRDEMIVQILADEPVQENQVPEALFEF